MSRGIRDEDEKDYAEVDEVLAFPGGSGTESMVAMARKAGVPVREVLE